MNTLLKLVSTAAAMAALYALATHDRPAPPTRHTPAETTPPDASGAFGGWKPSRRPVTLTPAQEAERVTERVKHARRIVRLRNVG